MATILLLLDNRENARLLADYLGNRHEVLLPKSEDALQGHFDLCILDGPALERLWEQVKARKRKAPAQFLPVLLVTSRKDVGMATRFLWEVVDELIISPIAKVELQARVENLLMARRLSLEFLRSVAWSAPLGIMVLDQEGIVQFWNPACKRIFGWEEKEVVGRPYPAVPPEQQEEFSSLLHRVFHGETLLQVEVTRRRKDGSPVDISFSAAPLHDSDGVIRHALTMAMDISERKKAEARAAREFERLTTLHSIDLVVASSLDLRLTLGVFLEHVIKSLNVDAADILLLDEKSRMLRYAAGRGFRSDALRYTLLPIGEGYAGRAILERKRVYVPDLREVENDLTRALARAHESFVAYVGVPLIAKGKIKGVLEIFHRAPLNPDEGWFFFLDSLATQAAIAIDNLELFSDLQRAHSELIQAYDATIEGWAYALELRDKGTLGHTQRLVDWTLKMARASGIKEEELVHIRRGVLLHDIGKIAVPDSILLKPDKLSDEEWEIMRRHPQVAYEMLSRVRYLQPALVIPYCHHEKWDGTGYPRGLKGEQIPLPARLFAIVDVWDALRSDRPYRRAWPEEKVLDYLRSQAGRHFDPDVVDLFFEVLAMG